MTGPALNLDRLLKLHPVIARFDEIDLARSGNAEGQLGRLDAAALGRGFQGAQACVGNSGERTSFFSGERTSVFETRESLGGATSPKSSSSSGSSFATWIYVAKDSGAKHARLAYREQTQPPRPKPRHHGARRPVFFNELKAGGAGGEMNRRATHTFPWSLNE